MSSYTPPFTLTTRILDSVERIGEALGRLHMSKEQQVAPHLRRNNRIRTIQASLAIEGNTLSIDQVTAVLAGKRVLGTPHEVQEVRNGFVAYEQLDQWQPGKLEHLCAAHKALMTGLLDDPGRLRRGSVGIKRKGEVIHIAPPAENLPALLGSLLSWLTSTDLHPLVASSVFHYELEFIHPFMDGNGRLGRLWQTLILGRWRAVFFFIPIETVIHNRQEEYYRALHRSDSEGSSTLFVDFMLSAILAACEELSTPEAAPEVTPEVQRLIDVLDGEINRREIQGLLRLKAEKNFRLLYLRPALDMGLIEMTIPDKPRSPRQCYRLTLTGQAVKKREKGRVEGDLNDA
ncbi:MAG: Fic family protein [Candidatus Electrothrix communis]|nr:MAG: Fic family protein [Candidatus Electrothrix communis]